MEERKFKLASATLLELKGQKKNVRLILNLLCAREREDFLIGMILVKKC